MMYFNTKPKREAVLKAERAVGYDRYAAHPSKFAGFISLCIHPHSWEAVYNQVKQAKRISEKNWDILGGVIHGILVLRKCNVDNQHVVSESIVDLVQYIRSDHIGDPWKFLFGFNCYFARYCTLRALTEFGIDWRDLAVKCMGASSRPMPRTFHSLFTNKYVRSLCKAMAVFYALHTPGEEGYQFGVNDMHTLVAKESKSKKCIGYDEMHFLVSELLLCLPAWNTTIRRQVTWRVGHLQDLSCLVERQALYKVNNQIN